MNREEKRTESSAQLEAMVSKKLKKAEKYARLAFGFELLAGLLAGAIIGAFFADLLRL